MMSGKRGQLAIFIILAIIVIAGVGIYFYIEKPGVLETAPEKSNSPIYVYAENCIESAIYNSIEIFGLQQGYYESPKNYFDTEFSNIAYYYFEGRILIPETSFFEEELSKIINEKIAEQCSDFSIFEEDGYNINSDIENINSEARISEDKIDVDISYPIFISENGISTGFSEFSYEISARVGHILDVSKILVEKIKESPGETDLTFLLNQDVDISVLDFDKCNKIYILIDENSTINGEPYAFSFAAGLEEKYCGSQE